MTFRLLTYRSADNSTRAGILVGDRVADVEAVLNDVAPGFAGENGFDPTSTFSIVQAWDEASAILGGASDAVARVRQSWPLEEVFLAAPIMPSNILCAGANYADHRKEMGGDVLDKTKVNPYFFNKVVRQSVIGPGEPIKRPHTTEKLDWECEIAVIIGKAGRNIPAEDAMDHVAGYTIINDLSARNFIRREDWPGLRSDWLSQKSFDTACPMGPWITPRSEIQDCQNLALKTWVNDSIEQDTNSEFMIFTVPELIETLSQQLTLQPGDMIATGTGSGVGHPKGKYLQPGDVCRLEIEGLGGFENPVVEGE